MRRRPLAVLAGLLLLAGAFAVRWLAHGFSARERPWAIEAYAARHLRLLAIPAEATAQKNPFSPTPALLADARDHFSDHCATCHALDGSGKTLINEGLYPSAPDLRDAAAQDLSDGELAYIIENGVRFTGMPGWGKGDDNWTLVLFIRHLPTLSREELEQMQQAAPWLMHRDHEHHDEHEHHHEAAADADD